MTSPNPVFITLGSNITPERHLPQAAARLAARFPTPHASRVYASVPLDAGGQPIPGQGAFLNAALLVHTTLPPLRLKYDLLRAIEAALGRVRTADKFAARTIDLDIALYGDLILESTDPRLHLPDPDILTRAHVALPLADLAPDFVHPATGDTLATIAAPFRDQPGITVREDIALLP
jgi:2-amino-4-hydroxy-6-hydroxymethyldihydropteridine diphosphokinase